MNLACILLAIHINLKKFISHHDKTVNQSKNITYHDASKMSRINGARYSKFLGATAYLGI